ncbi:RNA polymerase sigma factor RpoE [Aquipluma nitroreducens]|uniref:RNA polymerase sigma factor n=1 Tax=Aquipluma nitroreducens TaxID=2010828 RepID=A0A5K7S9K7_9BACT|nr:sigma-70 family RNA polymerase sigma factor [Aquipluma nitroreducens]BBE18250.1 RNA polymerase sigma factor RpoE [Aquipluma nitroreducens]
MDEAQLIKGIQQGDHKSFQILVETYQRMVVNTCLGIVHNQADAEDLAQDVFLEIFRTAEKFRGDSKLSTWLYRIATNRSLNLIRNNKRKRFFQSIEETFTGGRNRSSEISENRADQPDQNMADQQRSDLLHRAIDRLPEKQRIAFTLNKYEELPYQQIAEIMEISLASVESLIHRAKKNLQEQLLDCYKRKCV